MPVENTSLPLRAKPTPAADFPVHALGNVVLGDAAQAIQERTQAPLALCSQSVLASATLATQAHANVQMPYGDTKPLSCFFVSIAESGERKTSCDGLALAPIKKHEALLRVQYYTNLKDFTQKHELWTNEKNRIYRNTKKSYEQKLSEISDLGDEPSPPLNPIYLCPSTTFQGLCKHLQSSIPTIGIFSSEGGQFVGGYGMLSEQRINTAAGMSTLWDGECLKHMTAGDGTQVTDGVRISMHVMLQPTLANQLFSDEDLRDQGFLSRTLTVYPNSTIGQRPFYPPSRSDYRLDVYNDRLTAIIQQPLMYKEDTENTLNFRTLELTPEAHSLWVQTINEMEQNIGIDKS